MKHFILLVGAAALLAACTSTGTINDVSPSEDYITAQDSTGSSGSPTGGGTDTNTGSTGTATDSGSTGSTDPTAGLVPNVLDPDLDFSTLTRIPAVTLKLGPDAQLEEPGGSIKARYTKFPPLDPRADAPMLLINRVFTVKISNNVFDENGKLVKYAEFESPNTFIDKFRNSPDILTPIFTEDTFDHFAMSWVALEPHNISYIEQIRTYDLERYSLQIVTLKSGEEWLVQADFDELVSGWAYGTNRKIIRLRWVQE